MIDHVAVIDSATPLPVSVDLESGYGEDPADAARAIEAAAAASSATGSVDPSRVPSAPAVP